MTTSTTTRISSVRFVPTDYLRFVIECRKCPQIYSDFLFNSGRMSVDDLFKKFFKIDITQPEFLGRRTEGDGTEDLRF